MGQIETPSKLGLSELAPRLVQSEIRAMTMECDRMGGVNLAQGVCDTEVPEVVTEGAIRAMRDGHNIYTRMDGIARLRKAIAGKVERTLGLTVDPEREVLVASGATGAFHAAAMALLNPGDEVLVFEPFYGYHVSTLQSMRVTSVPVALTAPGLGSGSGGGAGGDYSEDASDGDQYAVESGGEGVYSDGAGGFGADCRGVRSVCVHG